MEKRVIVFGSDLCPDCVRARKKLDEAGVPHVDASITENLSNMKVFLDYRDRLSLFDTEKSLGHIGIPFFVVDKEKFYLEVEKLLQDLT